MSRIARKPIKLPGGVDVSVNGDDITVKGGKGELKKTLPFGLVITKDDEGVHVNAPEIKAESAEEKLRIMRKKYSANVGLAWSLINSMVEGVSKGFSRKLVIEGVGYRASVAGDSLVLTVGFADDRKIKIPADLTITTPEMKRGENPSILIEGMEKQKVGEMAAYIRRIRPVEPYKGKGIRYSDEQVRRKEGKAASK